MGMPSVGPSRQAGFRRQSALAPTLFIAGTLLFVAWFETGDFCTWIAIGIAALLTALLAALEVAFYVLCTLIQRMRGERNSRTGVHFQRGESTNDALANGVKN